MIDPKELRIGNLVFISLHERRVTSIDQKSSFNVGLDDEDLYGDDEINPIPITPEWLERLGFEKVLPCGDDEFVKYYKGGIELINRFDVIYFPYGYRTKRINHVHQLQNLYFALTGSDLI